MTRFPSLLAVCASCATGCSMAEDVVFVPLVVEFSEASSSATEDIEETPIAVRLSHASTERVTFRVVTTDVTASGHDACDSRDYSIYDGEATFEPGQTETTVILRQLNDDSQ